uniref:Repetitive proline-rich cell wall protein 2 n=1 Tax=Lepeophtheirus salmonis TaxID=72036 RepID=C1BVN4_LEPSM|nr:Repetitive proline-rich cell wall protein 2 precursor [Lepeophtheirus salmonis]
MIRKLFLTFILVQFAKGDGPPTPSPIYYKPYVPPTTQQGPIQAPIDLPPLSTGSVYRPIASSPPVLQSLPALPAYSSYIAPPPQLPPQSSKVPIYQPIIEPSPLPAPSFPTYRPTTPSVPVNQPLTQPPTSVYKPYVPPPPSEPANYVYEYFVFDAESGVDISADEQAINGDVEGSYKVALPDGRIQTVTYYVIGNSGFVADVKYEVGPSSIVVEPYPQYGSYIK